MLKTIANMNISGRSFSVHQRQLNNVIRRNSSNASNTFRSIRLHMLSQLFVTYRKFLHELFINKSTFKQDMHHTESECTIRSGIKRNKPVCPLSRTIAMNVDHNQLGSLLAPLLNQSKLMHIRADNIASPYDK
ncbi:hypothetical protein D3C76_907740 [compost metagenome]